jgi:hypothetical protein
VANPADNFKNLFEMPVLFSALFPSSRRQKWQEDDASPVPRFGERVLLLRVYRVTVDMRQHFTDRNSLVLNALREHHPGCG